MVDSFGCEISENERSEGIDVRSIGTRNKDKVVDPAIIQTREKKNVQITQLCKEGYLNYILRVIFRVEQHKVLNNANQKTNKQHRQRQIKINKIVKKTKVSGYADIGLIRIVSVKEHAIVDYTTRLVADNTIP